MNCSEIEIQLEEFVAGELEAPNRATLEAHLANCASCTRSVADVRRIEAMLALARLPEPDAAFFERQRMAVMTRLGREIEWQAPRLSLLLMLSIVAGYIGWSIEPLMDSVADLTANVGRFWTSLDGLGLLYGLLLILGLATFRHDPSSSPALMEVRR
ncbi:MAG: zf-HC2 domain-containing protein [Candidatus Wallbacteria bacterium]|nr:zf-HC2 domain-containing protein [Candidatus Wallbacteria bacterium]